MLIFRSFITLQLMTDFMRVKDQALTSISSPPLLIQDKQRVRTREQPGNLAIGRATLIKTGAKSIRREYHNLPLDLPPPPGESLKQVISTEHLLMIICWHTYKYNLAPENLLAVITPLYLHCIHVFTFTYHTTCNNSTQCP